MLTYGSVCSGIEAASVAWEPLGFRPAWFSEIEPFPSTVLTYRWPHVSNLGDMTKIKDLVALGLADAPDVLVGGTPCQSFSLAGLRNGLDDERGQLTLEFVRLANEIDEQRKQQNSDPTIVVWENVPGVLTSKDNAFGCLLAGLVGEDDPLEPAGKKWTNAGCVFGPKRAVAWRVLDAQYFGVAQRRRRVFVVASARNGFDPTKVLFEFDGLRRDTPPSREAGQAVAGTLASRTGAGGFPGTDEACSGYVQPVGVTCIAHGQGGAEIATDRSPTLTCNHEAPIAVYSSSGAGYWKEGVGPLRAREQDAHEMLYAVHGTQDPCVSKTTAFALGRNNGAENAVFVTRDVAQAITANYGKQCDSSDTALGPNVAICITGDITHTLKAEGFDASEDGTGRGQPIVPAYGLTPDMAVRRLTPTECERLQGFPDGHTLVPYRNKPAADGPRYKALGNSMAVPCMRFIGERIQQKVAEIKNANS